MDDIDDRPVRTDQQQVLVFNARLWRAPQDEGLFAAKWQTSW
ncbi:MULTISPECIES: hypothetical protein [unclassified Bradyrhizobium]|nr:MULTISPECIES: hypothetical protein [unclassified Bradyrhizobium]